MSKRVTLARTIEMTAERLVRVLNYFQKLTHPHTFRCSFLPHISDIVCFYMNTFSRDFCGLAGFCK